MNDIIEFLKVYWFQVASIVVSIITFIVLLVKKKIKLSDTALSMVLMKLPGLISEAELKYTDGKAKKLYVITAAIDYYKQVGGLPNRDITEVISQKVEDILVTPTKKEDK